MKTIEERAFKSMRQNRDRSIKLFHPKCFTDWEYGYCQGATEQREIDDKAALADMERAFQAGHTTAIDEACEWLYDNIVCMQHATKTLLLVRLRKAMGEE